MLNSDLREAHFSIHTNQPLHNLFSSIPFLFSSLSMSELNNLTPRVLRLQLGTDHFIYLFSWGGGGWVFPWAKLFYFFPTESKDICFLHSESQDILFRWHNSKFLFCFLIVYSRNIDNFNWNIIMHMYMPQLSAASYLKNIVTCYIIDFLSQLSPLLAYVFI